MKILFTVEFYEPHKGGAEEAVKQISERLILKGHEVTIATSFISQRRFSELNGIKIESFKIFGNLVNGIYGSNKEIKKYQMLLLRNFDVIINYATQIWTTDLTFNFLDKIPAKKILIPCGYSGLKNSKYREYFYNLPRFLKKYDSLVYMSPSYQDKIFGDQNGVGEKAVIIPNGASEEEFLKEDTFNIRGKLDIKTKYLLISVSNHYKTKGHAFIINAFRKTKRKDTTLLIIGEKFVSFGIKKIAHFLLDYCHCALYSLIDKNVRFSEGNDRELVLSAYKSADLFLFGSEIECAPLVMYESFASKTIFITTNVGNISDYIGYLKIVSSPSEMSNVVNIFLNDREKREKLTEKAFRLWKEKYTWQKITELYEKLFASFVR
ncbi:MAG: glycosyltransferase family 4 protein [Patescibacteria group bacterium]|nr:glycosyltransferase family 4 protein [Patescibacteria group bacterium]